MKMSEAKEVVERRQQRGPSRTRAMLFGVGLAALGGLVAVPVVFAATQPSGSGEHAVVAGAARVTVEIPEVSCAGCSVEARKALKAAGGVVGIGEGDPKNRLVLTYEPGSGRPEGYVDALHKAGFAKAHEVARN